MAFENAENRVARFRNEHTDYSELMALRGMDESRAAKDIVGCFKELAESTDTYQSANNLPIFAIVVGTVAFAAVLATLMLLRGHSAATKIGAALIAFCGVLVLSILVRELVLNRIAKKIARCYDHLDNHYRLRNKMVDNVRDIFERGDAVELRDFVPEVGISPDGEVIIKNLGDVAFDAIYLGDDEELDPEEERMYPCMDSPFAVEFAKIGGGAPYSSDVKPSPDEPEASYYYEQKLAGKVAKIEHDDGDKLDKAIAGLGDLIVRLRLRE
ncbi:hypothetical protein IKF34_02115 [Candidatus Saccharibacteria bacterium]|nr:hypothetical protein [Candidatus Saccharibacteria bacterium]